MGEKFANKAFIDALNNCQDEVIIDEEGFGNFYVKSRSLAVWVEK